MMKETKTINGNDVTVIWGDWERAGDQEQQRFIEKMIINGVEVEVSDSDSAGQVKNADGSIIGVYYDGEPMEEHLDPVEVAFTNVTA